MNKVISLIFLMLPLLVAQAAWYWPFSSKKDKPPRVSELMEPASLLIDEAVDLAAEDKNSEAVEKYRLALKELDRIEAENPDRVDSPEFMTLKHKRAYIDTAIGSLLLHQAQLTSKPVAISDTTELQKKYDAKIAAKKGEGREKEKVKAEAKVKVKAKAEVKEEVKEEKKGVVVPRRTAATTFEDKLKLAVDDLKRKDYDAVDLLVKELLDEKPNDDAALNLKAVSEIGRGDIAAAEKTLDTAIMSNPRSYHAYYNMARLMLGYKGNRSSAERYYETGRAVGGPVDKILEGKLK